MFTTPAARAASVPPPTESIFSGLSLLMSFWPIAPLAASSTMSLPRTLIVPPPTASRMLESPLMRILSPVTVSPALTWSMRIARSEFRNTFLPAVMSIVPRALTLNALICSTLM